MQSKNQGRFLSQWCRAQAVGIPYRCSSVWIGVMLWIVAAAPVTAAQRTIPVNLSTDAARAATVQLLQQQSQQAKAQAVAVAQQRGWLIRGEIKGRVYELVAIREDGRPLYYVTCNANAAISTAAAQIRDTAPYNLNGAGLFVGIWDAGMVRTTHQEYAGRVRVLDGTTNTNIHYHSTHVGGTIGATGVVTSARGMAPRAKLDSYDWNSDASEMASRAATAPGQTNTMIYVSNHSYGYALGWDWNYSPVIYWGVAGEREDRDFGRYDSTAALWDGVLYNAPYYLPFKAAGNDRSDAAPTAGTTYQYYTGSVWTNKTYDPATDPYADGWYLGGYDTMDSVACAKNVMTVGAVNDAVSGGSRVPANGTMSTFSNWGPTDDGRIKPDIVANGVGLYSTYSTSDTSYSSLNGTSMATPNAAGSAILLVEYYARLLSGQAMRASTLKGLILHTADDLGTAGPDYAYGWGLMNAKAAADQIQRHATNATSQAITEGLLTSAVRTNTVAFTWDGVNPIRATLCWSDPAGLTKTGLNNRTSVLVNDLDLRITGPGGSPVYQPFRLDVNNPTNAATTGDNTLDNIEQVLIAAPSAGRYLLTITHKGTLTGNQQHYSLILSGNATDNLGVTPSGSFITRGPRGGPFTPASQIYTLTNNGVASLNWLSTANQSWITATPSNGTLAAGGSTAVTVTINSNANSFGTGAYGGAVAFSNLTASASLERSVAVNVNIFDNPAGIMISGSGTGIPYASTITVSGMVETVTKVTATLLGVSHTFPDDLDILLVSPTGQKAILMSDTGGSYDINNVMLAFDDSAGSTLPDSTQISSGTYRPTNIGTTDTFPAPAPASPYGTSLTAFTNQNPNGTWSLYVNDDRSGDGGAIGGWYLTFTTTNIPGQLVVTPSGGLTSAGVEGGPFSPSSQIYTLTNNGGSSINWQITKGQTWVGVSTASGDLASGAATNVTVSINSNANSLAVGSYSDTVTFANLTSGIGTTNRLVSLTVNPTPGQIVVNPASLDFGSITTGTTSQQVFVVSNIGGVPVTNGTAATAGPFSIVVGAMFSVPVGGSTNVTVQFAPGVAGSFTNNVIFTTANGGGSTNPVTGTGLTPALLVVTPSSWNFNTIATGTTAQTSFIVTNQGGSSLSGSATVAPPFGIVSGSPFAVGGYGWAEVVVNFTPPSEGSYNDNVLFTSNGGNSTNAVSGAGAVMPVALFSASPTNGVAPLLVTFTDTSTGTITNRSWSFGDGATTNTALTAMSHSYANPSTNTVRLIVSGPLGASTNTQANSILVVSPAQIAVTPEARDFGNVTIGQTNYQSFSVINNGGATLSGTATSAAPFAVSAGSPYNVAPGQTSTVTLAFMPSIAGVFTNNAIFASNGGDSTNQLTGAALTPALLQVTPPLWSFGVVATGATVQTSFTVTNAGGSSLSGSAAVPAPFGIVSGSPFALDGFAATNVVVSFTPASVGDFGTNVLFTSTGGNSTNAVSGTGAVMPVALFSASPTNGVAPLLVTFTDISTGTITNRFWSFGDGATTNTVLTDLTHVYASPSTNTVTLIVAGPLGANTNTQAGCIIVTTAYGAWQTTQFTPVELADPLISGDTADPDHDGIPNLMEYAFGLGAKSNGVSGLPTAGVTNNFLNMTYRWNKQAADLIVSPEACSVLTTNLWSTNGVVVISTVDCNTWWNVTVSTTNRFMRLRITRP